MEFNGIVALMSSSKLETLKSLLRSYESCLVAYSGGVDSAFLAVTAHQVLGDKALAVIADSPSLPRREFEAAARTRENALAMAICRNRTGGLGKLMEKA